jgi:hypothetical protein
MANGVSRWSSTRLTRMFASFSQIVPMFVLIQTIWELADICSDPKRLEACRYVCYGKTAFGELGATGTPIKFSPWRLDVEVHGKWPWLLKPCSLRVSHASDAVDVGHKRQLQRFAEDVAVGIGWVCHVKLKRKAVSSGNAPLRTRGHRAVRVFRATRPKSSRTRVCVVPVARRVCCESDLKVPNIRHVVRLVVRIRHVVRNGSGSVASRQVVKIRGQWASRAPSLSMTSSAHGF